MTDNLQTMRRTRQTWDTEDLALAFIEEEVGRHDWAANWKKVKAGNVRQQIKDWLQDINVQHDPDEISAFLDGMVAGRQGKWV